MKNAPSPLSLSIVSNETSIPGRKSRPLERLELLIEQFRTPVEEYLTYCRELNYSECVLAGMLSVLPRFCQFLIELGLCSLHDLKPAHISRYIQSLCKLAPHSASSYGTIVRCFLRFLYLRQIVKSDMSSCVPSYHVANYAKIPSIWPLEEVEKLLAQVDRGSPQGKRDYAILLLAAQTGMRVGDIIRLKFSNINWEQKRMEIVQSKTKTPLTIPMSEELGWALIEYIKNARPKSESDIVFLSLLSPYSPFVIKDSLHHIITKYRRMAGIQKYAKQRGGMHTLRHTLASNLLAHGTPLPIISNILGHTNPASTSYYIKVDITHLRECAIDPDEVSTDA